MDYNYANFMCRVIMYSLQTGRRSNSEFDLIAQELRQVRYKGKLKS